MISVTFTIEASDVEAVLLKNASGGLPTASDGTNLWLSCLGNPASVALSRAMAAHGATGAYVDQTAMSVAVAPAATTVFSAVLNGTAEVGPLVPWYWSVPAGGYPPDYQFATPTALAEWIAAFEAWVLGWPNPLSSAPATPATFTVSLPDPATLPSG